MCVLCCIYITCVVALPTVLWDAKHSFHFAEHFKKNVQWAIVQLAATLHG